MGAALPATMLVLGSAASRAGSRTQADWPRSGLTTKIVITSRNLASHSCPLKAILQSSPCPALHQQVTS